jgi:hypothetical protein
VAVGVDLVEREVVEDLDQFRIGDRKGGDMVGEQPLRMDNRLRR